MTERIEDLRQRCSAHEQWMSSHPEAIAFAQELADRNAEDLPRRRVVDDA